MSWKFPFSIFLLIVASSEARNLTCFVCDGCNNFGMTARNLSGCNWCEKQTLNGIVNKLCAKNDCPNIPEGFNGKFTYDCCQKDYCNESSHFYPTIVIWSLLVFGGSLVKV
ncbi:hypothetical protein PHET_00139 [Paragonimus heterotremus]|uniref:UPAR/Ly6 domain-containing protein n=1 Tax=Paragonimus heterotremus TaxID=100268 RepID=A0A8J4SU59_9TREM|nr:hypothetical protein PHET_00139 [Paragonimus heterotremus]